MTTEFTTDGVDVSGTTLQGFITCSYDTLCQVFGEPVSGDGYKTRAEWNGKTPDGVVFTIYDWRERKGIGDVTDWHIGGNDLSVFGIGGINFVNVTYVPVIIRRSLSFVFL